MLGVLGCISREVRDVKSTIEQIVTAVMHQPYKIDYVSSLHGS
jgi:hypothetical protein